MRTLNKIIAYRFAPLLPPTLALLVVIGLAAWPDLAYAYWPVARWQTNSSEWRNYITGAPFPSNATSLVDAAAQKWSKPATGKNFTLYNYQSIPGPTRVSTRSVNFASNGWADDPGTALLAYNLPYLAAVSVYLNNTWSWNTSCSISQSQKKEDFRVVILHELGHTVSLNHDPNNTSAVMWPDFTCKLNLTQDDKNGIGYLYP
jgi:hypothetical protein